MDHKVVIEYQEVVVQLEKKFGEGLELDTILVLIGIQELGQGYKEFSKDEKMNLMHIAICTILEPFGYYKFKENDKDGWPHFDKMHNLPPLNPKEQEYLMKEAVTQYFKQNDYL
ncbi:MAG: hypothetical protein R2780_13635 [Crocinitomicaceae bacterium]|nr:hypothetical protein [Crocinitomicaceae bacterium]